MEPSSPVVVITGAGRGLGKALADGYAARQAKLVLADVRQEEVAAVASALQAVPVVVDVTDEGRMEHLAQTALEHFGRIDCWINNAGIWMPHAPIEEQEVKRMRDLLEVNFFGTLYGSRAAYVRMRKHGGTIINILSIRVLEPKIGTTGYAASKAAATAMTKTLRMEAAAYGIRVFGVYPARIHTQLFEEKMPESFDDHMDPAHVAERIIVNAESSNPELDLVIS